MSRLSQKRAEKGSQRWLQHCVNNYPHILLEELKTPLQLKQDDSIIWLSPLQADEYAEYRDEAFLDKTGIKLEASALKSFWPHGGPVWDGLAKTSRDDVLLVESKAHIGEQASPACKASGAALLAIRERLEETKRYLQVRSEADWSGTYYQYANRLAHLYGLRVLNDYPVWLVFLYFVNASDVHGPKSAQEWKSAIKDLHDHLGIVGHSLMNYVVEIFVDVNRLNLDSGGG